MYVMSFLKKKKNPIPEYETWHDGSRMYARIPQEDGLHGAIHRAFKIMEADSEELSFGDRDDLVTTHIHDLQLLQPEGPRCEYEALWLTMIAQHLDEGWRVAYSNGCRRDNHHAYACYRVDRRGGGGRDSRRIPRPLRDSGRQ